MNLQELAKLHPGPTTIAGVRREWSPAKVAQHMKLSKDAKAYVAQSVFLAANSLFAVGATDEQVADHVEDILAACGMRMVTVSRAMWGHA